MNKKPITITIISQAMKSLLAMFGLVILLIPFKTIAHTEITVDRNNENEIAKVKTAFIYNFLKYIELQNNMPLYPDTFNVCVFGKNPFGEALHNMNGRKARGVAVKVVALTEIAQARSCHIIYISQSESNNIFELLSAIREHSILTVSDISNFPNIGGIVGFTQTRDKIGIEINLNNANKAKVKISALLLEIAKIIE